jgi:hypothetical protein
MQSAPIDQARTQHRQQRKIRRKDDPESAERLTTPSPRRRSVSFMKRTLLIALLALGLIVLAVAAWTVQGIRWTLRGGRNRRERLATA